MTEQFTAQFNHLLKEKDSFNAATAAAERERRREEQILSGHRTAAQQIAEQLNVAKSNDGETSRKLQNLRESKLRLSKQIEVDRAEIVKVTNELRGKESEEKKQKWKFVKEMEGINDELDDLLCKAEDEKTLRLIDADTVQWLLETKMPMMNHSEGMDENCVEAENEKWRVVQSKIEEGLSALVEAREKLDVQVGEKQQLENMLVEHREKFKAMFTVSGVFCILLVDAPYISVLTTLSFILLSSCSTFIKMILTHSKSSGMRPSYWKIMIMKTQPIMMEMKCHPTNRMRHQ